MSGHTPGPWLVHGKYRDEVWNAGGDIMVAHCDHDPSARPDGGEAEGFANAKLIAAAPDHALLLAAIVAGVARWQPFEGDHERAGEICVGGLAYGAHLDATGCPELADGRRAALVKALRDAGWLP